MLNIKKVLLFIIKILVALGALTVLILLYYYFTSKILTVTTYEEKTNIESSFRILQLTDLHNEEFGKNNSKLIKLVDKQKPDLIVMTGDMINYDDSDLSIIRHLITELNKTAQVYYGYGNHETKWEDKWGKDFHDELADTGAIMLNNEYLDIDIKGNKVRLAGYMGYYWQPHMMTKDKTQQQIERDFYGSFQDTDRYKILLNHIPTQWLDWNYIDKCHVDFVLCGHYHGGTIRIPFMERGLFAPYVGWWPPFTKGIFRGKETTCVLSTGLGTEHSIPRLNNPPEIVVVDFKPNWN